MKIKLVSDFNDYYDHFFDLNGDIPFTRKMKMGPDRKEMLFLMTHLGFKVPTHGTVTELHTTLSRAYGENAKKLDINKVHEVVVYHDLNAHAGESKEKMTMQDAFEKYPTAYASQWIPSANDSVFQSRTWRMLMVGSTPYWMEYKSKTDWRSNAGEISINLIRGMDAQFVHEKYGIYRALPNIKVPLYAIDFVPTSNNQEIIAVDFNVSPGIKGTPVEDVLNPEQAALKIKDRIKEILEN